MTRDPLNRWTTAMLEGDFEAAWRVTDELQQSARYGREAHHLLWDGTPMEGRDVLIRCRHGLGDTIQFVRYQGRLLEAGARVYVDPQPALGEMIQADVPPAATDCVEIECMELPYAFRTQMDSIPCLEAYLTAPARPPFFRSSGQRLSVGLIWAAGEWNPARTMGLGALAPVGRVRDAAFYSLQQGPAREELKDAGFEIATLSGDTSKIADAAAAMSQLDLIITVDSMTAHLAGALGRPVWTLLPYEADWRWMRDRDDSPWYPTMRLFRQRSPGGWEEVVRRVATELIRY